LGNGITGEKELDWKPASHLEEGTVYKVESFYHHMIFGSFDVKNGGRRHLDRFSDPC
jgi:hypothetical protein